MPEHPAPLRPDWLVRPHPGRLHPDGPGYGVRMAAHRAAVQAGQAGYLDPDSGLFVMTALNLADRGWCCDRGCRHCPWVGADLPEPADQLDDEVSEP